MNRLLRCLEEILWPRRHGCLCCEDFSHGEWLCPTCRAALASMRLKGDDAGTDSIRSIYRYDGNARQLVRMLKEDCLADAATVLAKAMAEEIRSMGIPDDTVMTWVTMPEIRRKKRGIDHGRVLCEAVASEAGLPVRQLLVRRENLHTQRGLSREERLRNIAGGISCEERITFPVLIVDDVLTTGATISACADALRKAGAVQVCAVTATRSLLKN